MEPTQEIKKMAVRITGTKDRCIEANENLLSSGLIDKKQFKYNVGWINGFFRRPSHS